jgi:predicted amidophosphoribosyltransferase
MKPQQNKRKLRQIKNNFETSRPMQKRHVIIVVDDVVFVVVGL